MIRLAAVFLMSLSGVVAGAIRISNPSQISLGRKYQFYLTSHGGLQTVSAYYCAVCGWIGDHEFPCKADTPCNPSMPTCRRGFDIRYLRDCVDPFCDGYLVSITAPVFFPTTAFFVYPMYFFLGGPLHRRGLCVKCGYNLTGNVSGVCPECGGKVPIINPRFARGSSNQDEGIRR